MARMIWNGLPGAGALALALALPLAACGGGDGGGVASTPPPTYTRLADLAGDQTLKTSGVSFTILTATPFSSGGYANGAIEDGSTGVTVAYNAAADSYTLTASDGASVTFGPQDVSTGPGLVPEPDTGVDSWIKTGPGQTDTLLLGAPSVNGVALSYTVFGTWMRTTTTTTAHLAVGGVPTIVSDLPRSGTASYSTAVGGSVTSTSSYLFGPASTATFTADFGRKTVSTTITPVLLAPLVTSPFVVTPVAPTIAPMTGTGTIGSATSTFSGTLAGGSGSGVFAGGFFGPKAAEMGYNFYFRDDAAATPFSAIGFVAGVKR